MRRLDKGEGHQSIKFRQLPLVCECGRTPSRLKSVGLTAKHELVIHWTCPACRRLVYIVKSLSDCWRACSESEEVSGVTPGAVRDFGPEDLAVLHGMRVGLPEDNE